MQHACIVAALILLAIGCDGVGGDAPIDAPVTPTDSESNGVLRFKHDFGRNTRVTGMPLGTEGERGSFSYGDFGASWSYVGDSEEGPVYVIRIAAPGHEADPEAVLYSGSEKLLYESEDGKLRVWIEPEGESEAAREGGGNQNAVLSPQDLDR